MNHTTDAAVTDAASDTPAAPTKTLDEVCPAGDALLQEMLARFEAARAEAEALAAFHREAYRFFDAMYLAEGVASGRVTARSVLAHEMMGMHGATCDLLLDNAGVYKTLMRKAEKIHAVGAGLRKLEGLPG